MSFNFYIVTLSVFNKKIIGKSDEVMYFFCFNIYEYMFLLHWVMSLTKYENGVAMVKRLRTTGIKGNVQDQERIALPAVLISLI
jgi:hypothetical protein